MERRTECEATHKNPNTRTEFEVFGGVERKDFRILSTRLVRGGRGSINVAKILIPQRFPKSRLCRNSQDPLSAEFLDSACDEALAGPQLHQSVKHLPTLLAGRAGLNSHLFDE